MKCVFNELLNQTHNNYSRNFRSEFTITTQNHIVITSRMDRSPIPFNTSKITYKLTQFLISILTCVRPNGMRIQLINV